MAAYPVEDIDHFFHKFPDALDNSDQNLLALQHPQYMCALDYDAADKQRYYTDDRADVHGKGGHGSVSLGTVQSNRSAHPSLDGIHAHHSLAIRGLYRPEYPLHSHNFSLLSDFPPDLRVNTAGSNEITPTHITEQALKATCNNHYLEMLAEKLKKPDLTCDLQSRQNAQRSSNKRFRRHNSTHSSSMMDLDDSDNESNGEKDALRLHVHAVETKMQQLYEQHPEQEPFDVPSAYDYLQTDFELFYSAIAGESLFKDIPYDSVVTFDHQVNGLGTSYSASNPQFQTNTTERQRRAIPGKMSLVLDDEDQLLLQKHAYIERLHAVEQSQRMLDRVTANQLNVGYTELIAAQDPETLTPELEEFYQTTIAAQTQQEEINDANHQLSSLPTPNNNDGSANATSTSISKPQQQPHTLSKEEQAKIIFTHLQSLDSRVHIYVNYPLRLRQLDAYSVIDEPLVPMATTTQIQMDTPLKPNSNKLDSAAFFAAVADKMPPALAQYHMPSLIQLINPFFALPPYSVPTHLGTTLISPAYHSPYAMLYPWNHNAPSRGHTVAVKQPLTNASFIGLSYDTLRELDQLTRLNTLYQPDFCMHCLDKWNQVKPPQNLTPQHAGQLLHQLQKKEQRAHALHAASGAPTAAAAAATSIVTTQSDTTDLPTPTTATSPIASIPPTATTTATSASSEKFSPSASWTQLQTAESLLPFVNRQCLCAFHSMNHSFDQSRWEVKNTLGYLRQRLHPQTTTQREQSLDDNERYQQCALFRPNMNKQALSVYVQPGNEPYSGQYSFPQTLFAHSYDLAVSAQLSMLERDATQYNLPKAYQLSSSAILPSCTAVTSTAFPAAIAARLIKSVQHRDFQRSARLYYSFCTHYRELHNHVLTDRFLFKQIAQNLREELKQQHEMYHSETPYVPFPLLHDFKTTRQHQVDPHPTYFPKLFDYHDITSIDETVQTQLDAFNAEECLQYTTLRTKLVLLEASHLAQMQRLTTYDDVSTPAINAPGDDYIKMALLPLILFMLQRQNVAFDDIKIAATFATELSPIFHRFLSSSQVVSTQDESESMSDQSSTTTSSTTPTKQPTNGSLLTALSPLAQSFTAFMQQGSSQQQQSQTLSNFAQHIAASLLRAWALQPPPNDDDSHATTSTTSLESTIISYLSQPDSFSRSLLLQLENTIADPLASTTMSSSSTSASSRQLAQWWFTHQQIQQSQQIPISIFSPRLSIVKLFDIVHEVNYNHYQGIAPVQGSYGLGSVNMILDFMQTDLQKVLRSSWHNMTMYHIKRIFYMVCRGVATLHRRFLLHRDLKPENVLISLAHEPLEHRMEIHPGQSITQTLYGKKALKLQPEDKPTIHFGLDPQHMPEHIRASYTKNIDARVMFHLQELEQPLRGYMRKSLKFSNSAATYRNNDTTNRGLSHFELSTLSCVVADFGGTKSFGDLNGLLSPQAVTIWYRAPELLLGSNMYSYPVDIWSLGCILAELLTGHVLFACNNHQSTINQLQFIVSIKGTPKPNELATAPFSLHSFTSSSQSKDDTKLIQILQHSHLLTKDGLELVLAMLSWNPRHRPTIEQVLLHPWFDDVRV